MTWRERVPVTRSKEKKRKTRNTRKKEEIKESNRPSISKIIESIHQHPKNNSNITCFSFPFSYETVKNKTTITTTEIINFSLSISPAPSLCFFFSIFN
jgi:hypothetical protein